MHEAVEDAGGLAVGLMLDVDASDIGSFAITGPMFAGSPEPPIAEVVVLLGGPASLFFSATAHGCTAPLKPWPAGSPLNGGYVTSWRLHSSNHV